MRDYIAVFDIGTSAVKGALIDHDANITGEFSSPLDTYYGENGEIEQDTHLWWEGVKKATDYWWTHLLVEPEQVVTITFSGQMEDTIPITDNDLYQNAILYSDTRAEKEAAFINKRLPDINLETGNKIHSSTPLAKMLWLEHQEVALFKHTDCFVFSAKDFIIYKLTGAYVTDPTTAATTGMMNLSARKWAPAILKEFGIHPNKLPPIYSSEKIVGVVTELASMETGFLPSTPVLSGCGDAGASTMGAHAVNRGDAYFYIGTTGWAAVISEESALNNEIEGTFNLAHLPENTTISIAPLLNAGNVHKWAATLYSDSSDDNLYGAFDDFINHSGPGSGGVIFLPYINGERCPVHDDDAKGAFWGIGPDTKKSDMARAVIEGVCFSYKQIVDHLIPRETNGILNLIGGGSKSSAWCQILSDVLGRAIRVPEESEYMPALGAAASAFVNRGWADDYQSFNQRFLITAPSTLYEPAMDNTEIYRERYEQYLKMYPCMKGIYS